MPCAPDGSRPRWMSPIKGSGAYSDRDIVDRVPMARFASPEDVAQAIAFLADGDRNGFINGVSLPVDGGWIADASWDDAANPHPDVVTRECDMWLRHTSANERRAMLAAYAGYGLDGFDFMIYTFVIPTLIALWGMNKARGRIHCQRRAVHVGHRRMGRGHSCRSVRPRPRAAADGGVVRGVYRSERLHAFLRSTVRHPRPARLRIRRRMGGGLGIGGGDHRGAPSRQGRRRGAKQLVGGLGRGGACILGGEHVAAAGHRLAGAVLDRHSACLVDHLHPPQRARTGGVHGAASERSGRGARTRRRRCLLEDISAAAAAEDLLGDVARDRNAGRLLLRSRPGCRHF